MTSTDTNEATDAKVTRTIDQLAELLGLPSWEEIDEINLDHYAEVASQVVKYDLENEAISDDEDDAYMEAERKVQDEVYSSWHGAVLYAAKYLFEAHGLDLVPNEIPYEWKDGTTGTHVIKVSDTKQLPWEYRIEPRISWHDAADKMRETVNGVGYFHFDTLAEFLDSGPYSYREAVIDHLSYVRRWPDVYGAPSARALYERGWS